MHAFLIKACAELDLQYGYVRFLDQCFDTTSDVETFLDSNCAPKHTRNLGKSCKQEAYKIIKHHLLWSSLHTSCSFFIQSTARIGDGGPTAATWRAGLTSVHPMICYAVVVVCFSVLVHFAFSKCGTSAIEVLRVKRFAVWFVLEGQCMIFLWTWLWYALATFILVTFLVVVAAVVWIFAMFEVRHALQRLRLMSKSDATSLPSSSSEA